MATKLVGQNYTTPDLVAKVTGKAKYSEDHRAEGMLFAKLLLSPMPHARVVNIDTSAALAMPGVKAILTADDLPGAQAGQLLGEGVVSTAQGERPLTNEPVYEGEPILAVAAVDEYTAAEAVEAIQIQFEPLPFAVDMLTSLRPGGPNARLQGNTWRAPAPQAAAGARGGAPAAGAAAGAAPAAGARGAEGARGGAQGAPAAPGGAAPQGGAAQGAEGARGARGGEGARGAAEAGAGARGEGGARGERGAAAGGGATTGAAGAQAGAEGARGRGEGRGAEGRGAEGGRGGGRGGPGGGGGPQVAELKWTQQVFDAAEEGQLPLGEHTGEFVVGDVEAALKSADLVLDETFFGSSTGHQPLEPRSAMAYWQNGKLYMHAGTQSTVQTVGAVATSVGIKPEEVVLISEYTGGGFGSKIPGAIFYAIPALLSKKANAPVMMRITREEEHYIGRARPGLLSRVKVGFRKDGKIVAIDGFAIQENGPYNQQGDVNSAGQTISLCYQPEAMRWRTLTVLTNTPPKTSQRAPGGMQGNGLMEPVITKAANKLGIDQVEIRRINAPEGRAPFGAAAASGQRQRVTDSHLKDALTKGAELFGWEEKKARSGRRVGTKVRGSGVAVSSYTAGSIGFDGLLVFRPDGKIQVQSGIGNLGTHSIFDVHRVAAEILDTPWEQFEVVFGDTAKNLPWTCISAGSQTAHAMTRAAHAVATAAKARLQEVAAKTYGGNPASYPVSNGRVGRMTFAEAAKKAIELGGIYDGHEVPETNNINAFTKRSVAGLAGQGLVVAARDNYPRNGASQSFVAGFAEVEVDVETGAYQILEFAAIADCGTVLNPRSLQGQTFGGVMLGIGHAIGQKWVYDQHYGVPLAKRFHYNKPPTILDAPKAFSFAALDIADPETPVGARGIGEPPVGAGLGAILNAIAAAVGDEVFRRAPVNADMILTSLEFGRRTTDGLTAHI